MSYLPVLVQNMQEVRNHLFISPSPWLIVEIGYNFITIHELQVPKS